MAIDIGPVNPPLLKEAAALAVGFSLITTHWDAKISAYIQQAYSQIYAYFYPQPSNPAPAPVFVCQIEPPSPEGDGFLLQRSP